MLGLNKTSDGRGKNPVSIWLDTEFAGKKKKREKERRATTKTIKETKTQP